MKHFLVITILILILASCKISQRDDQKLSQEMVSGIGNQELPLLKRNFSDIEVEILESLCNVLENKLKYMHSLSDDFLFQEKDQEYHFCGQSTLINKSQKIRFFIRSYNKILPEYYLKKSNFYFNDPLFSRDNRFINYCDKVKDVEREAISNVQKYNEDLNIILSIDKLRNGNFILNWRVFDIQNNKKTIESSTAEIIGDKDEQSEVGVEINRTRRRICDSGEYDYLKETLIMINNL